MLAIDRNSGRLSSATFCPSPNFDARPVNVIIDLLVIHGISLPPGEFGTKAVQAFFCNQLDPKEHPYFEQIAALRVSSHLYISREGQIWQFVPFHLRAWHAGQSNFLGRENCNNYSIGIELEGTDDIPYTQAQYAALVLCSNSIMACYPQITLDRIVGHSDIAPSRKTDPGPAFDWVYFQHLLKKNVG